MIILVTFIIFVLIIFSTHKSNSETIVVNFNFREIFFLQDENKAYSLLLHSLTIYDSLSDKLPHNYGIFVNKSILWDKLDNISMATYNNRIAERIVPSNIRVRQIGRYLSGTEESSQKQAKISVAINPDYIFLLFVVLFNSFIFVLVKLVKNKNITSFTLMFLSLILKHFCAICADIIFTQLLYNRYLNT